MVYLKKECWKTRQKVKYHNLQWPCNIWPKQKCQPKIIFFRYLCTVSHILCYYKYYLFGWKPRYSYRLSSIQAMPPQPSINLIPWNKSKWKIGEMWFCNFVNSDFFSCATHKTMFFVLCFYQKLISKKISLIDEWGMVVFQIHYI